MGPSDGLAFTGAVQLQWQARRQRIWPGCWRECGSRWMFFLALWAGRLCGHSGHAHRLRLTRRGALSKVPYLLRLRVLFCKKGIRAFQTSHQEDVP